MTNFSIESVDRPCRYGRSIELVDTVSQLGDVQRWGGKPEWRDWRGSAEVAVRDVQRLGQEPRWVVSAWHCILKAIRVGLQVYPSGMAKGA